MSSWEVNTIEKVCDILDSKRKPITKRNRTPGDIPYYGATGVLDYVEGYLFDEELVLLGEDGAKWESGDNSAFRIKGKAWVNNHAHVLRPNRDVVIDDWLIYNLNFQNLMPYVSGMTVPKLNQGNMKKIKIPIPPLPEQKHIVAILDEVFGAIDKAKSNIERNIENAEELFQSKLNEIFSQRKEGWEEKSLGELTNVKSGGTPRRSIQEYWNNGTIPWYSSGELNELFTTESERLITKKGLKESNAKLFPEGSLLIGMYDTAALKMSILDRDATFNQAISGVKPNDGLNLQFVMHAINAIKPALMEQRRGVRQKNLNLTKIKAIPIPNPKIEIQDEVVVQLSELKDYTITLINTYQTKLKGLEELKKSLLQKAFSGELTENETLAA